MIHSYENAKAVLRAYKHLVSSYSELKSTVTDICIVPADEQGLAKFLEYYKELEGEAALQKAGFDPEAVRLVVIHEQTLTSPGSLVDLDDYLSSKGIRKSYDPVTRTFVTLN